MVHTSMRSVQRERETLRERGRERGEQMEAKRNGTDCPLGGEGERQGERSLHIQAAHFLTNYCCKTSLSPFFPTGPCSLLSHFAVWDRRKNWRAASTAGTQMTEREKARGAVTETVTRYRGTKEKGRDSDQDLMRGG